MNSMYLYQITKFFLKKLKIIHRTLTRGMSKDVIWQVAFLKLPVLIQNLENPEETEEIDCHT